MGLRVARKTDLANMLLWRNQIQNRHVMFNAHYITENEHFDWWDKKSKERATKILIFEFENQPAGVVIFFDIDFTAKSAHWGFYLDVESLEKNKSLLTCWLRLERETIIYAKETLQLTLLICETLARNSAVLKLHLRNNFKTKKEYYKLVEKKLEKVVETHLEL